MLRPYTEFVADRFTGEIASRVYDIDSGNNATLTNLGRPISEADTAQWDIAKKRWLPYHVEPGTDSHLHRVRQR